MRATRRSAQDGRAALFAVGALVALFVAIPFSMWLAKTPTNISQADRLGAEIGCVCGTCPLRPIATCGCGFADGMLARLDQEITGGHSDDEIMAVFVAEYGPAIKIKPAGSGVGLLAWLAPMALLMVGAVVIAGVLSHWRANHPSDVAASEMQAAAATSTSDDSLSAEASAESDRYRDLVERELDAFDD